MKFVIGLLATIALIGDPVAARSADECELPQSFVTGDTDLTRVMSAIKDQHRLNISVIGTGSSALPGPDGARFAYPARLEAELKKLLPGTDITVTAHVQSRKNTSDMAAALTDILSTDKPALVIWQAGTVDALNGIEPEEFRTSLEGGVEAITSAGADAILMNMQYSPRTESMLDVSAYADAMRFVAQQHSALLFDRLGIMRYWNDAGTFDLYAATKNYDMARQVHDCIGRGLASQIINAAHLAPEEAK